MHLPQKPRCFGLFLASSLLCSPALARTPSRAPIVAVFSIQDRTGKLSPETVQQLSDYLTAQVAVGGVFQVVPRGQLKERLTREKVESYKPCYDEKCQIEIGRELAAQKSLATQISPLGDRCVVVVTLFDLKRATSQASASEKSGCDQPAIINALEAAVKSIKQQMAPEHPPSTGGLLIKSTPAGAEIFLDGVKHTERTPTVLRELKVGKHTLRLTAEDHVFHGEVAVIADQVNEVSFTLKLTAAAERRLAEVRLAEQEERELIIEEQQAEQEDLQDKQVSRRSKGIWAYTTLGTGLAAAAAAGVLYGVGFSSRSAADTRYMAGNSQTERDLHWADVESADTVILTGHIAAGVAGLALGISIYHFATRPAANKSSGPAVKAGMLDPRTGAGLSVSGSF